MEYYVNMEFISGGCAIAATPLGWLLKYSYQRYKRLVRESSSCSESVLEERGFVVFRVTKTFAVRYILSFLSHPGSAR